MSTILSKYAAQTYALMRIVTGFLFLCHGTQKLFGIPQAAHQAPPFITHVGGSIELIGGILSWSACSRPGWRSSARERWRSRIGLRTEPSTPSRS